MDGSVQQTWTNPYDVYVNYSKDAYDSDVYIDFSLEASMFRSYHQDSVYELERKF